MEQTGLVTLVHSNLGDPQTWMRIDSLEGARLQFDHFSTPLCFVGHTHVPFVCGEDLQTVEVRKGLRFLINVGSVGQSRDGDRRLSFGYLDTGTWEYRNIRVEYDVEGATRNIRETGLRDALADRLLHGL